MPSEPAIANFKVRNFIEFMRSLTAKPIVATRLIKAEKKNQGEADNFKIIPASRLPKIISENLSNAATAPVKADIKETKIAQWLATIKNINQEYLLPLPKRSVKAMVKKTIKNPSYVYPLAHSVKEKTAHVRRKTVRKLSNNPWGAELVAICLVSLMVSVSICRLAPDEGAEILKISDRIFMAPIQKLIGAKNVEPTIGRENLAEFIIQNKDELKAKSDGSSYALTITAADLLGLPVGAYSGENGATGTKKNQKNNSSFDKAISKVANFSKNILNKLADSQNRLAEDLKNKLVNTITK